MTDMTHVVRGGLAAGLAALHLGLALGAGIHEGPHRAQALAELPAEYHDHHYRFAPAPPEVRSLPDTCLACTLSRVVPRLPAPSVAPAATPLFAAGLAAPKAGHPAPAELDRLGPRAPPLA